MEFGGEGHGTVHQVIHAKRISVVEALVPFGELRIESRGFADELGLIVVWRSARRSAGHGNENLNAMTRAGAYVTGAVIPVDGGISTTR